jgi:uncharacterized protein (DUF488 family)
MDILLCTIGFAGKTAEEFFSLLRQAGVEKLVDIRQHRGGQLSGFAKHPDLAFFLAKIAGIAYAHEPQLAPTPELLKSYRQSKDWTAYESRFLGLMESRGMPHSLDLSAWPARISLLCSEPGPEKCHRRLVADLLAVHWRKQGHRVEIRHLVADGAKSAPASSRTRASKHGGRKSLAAP